jgi:hypothetical protein
MKIRMILLAGAAALTVGSSASAGSKLLATAPAFAGYPGVNSHTLYCDCVNVGTKPVDVFVEILEYNGTVVTSQTFTLAPGTGNALTGGSGVGAWCRFTPTAGSTKNLRGVAIYDDGTAYRAAIPAQ